MQKHIWTRLKGCLVMEKLSFKTLHENYAVIIPMLQRDYAYGRENEEEKREHFLKNLKEYLADAAPHELDFVYGCTDQENNIKLLDGQQRITTLFILHWYLSLLKDENGQHHFDDFRNMMLLQNGESKFSYKTRFSSSDFCNILVTMQFQNVNFADKYSDIIADKKTILSRLMRQEKWFLPHWNYDPTITGMLNMIDAIKTIFTVEECVGYYEKLINNGQIIFNFLNLDDFQLTDELYIKMNSRGRPLTRFENLKSKLLPLYDEAKKIVPTIYQQKLDRINLNSSKKYTTLRDYVSFMFDTKWTDVFWNEWINTTDRSEKPNVDDMMLCFISVLSINEHILYKLNGNMSLIRKDPLTKEINDLMSQKDKNVGITIKYDKLIALFKENNYAFLFKLIDYFNIFNGNGTLKTYYAADFEKDLFSHIANDYKSDKMEYEWKARVFAYTLYLLKNPSPDPNKLKAWMRFVCNVCANSYTLPNGTETFCTALAGINYLYCEDVKTEISTRDLSKITAVLDVPQIEEEILKMKLSCDKNWEASINDAEEKLAYFEGRLRYPLMDCCRIDETSISDDVARARFNEYVNKISAIFADKSGCRHEVNLIRALLSKGDYLMYFNSSNTFLKNADRDNSWRRYLKAAPDPETNAWHPHTTIAGDTRDYFKAVIDDPQFDVNNVLGSLKAIAKNRDNDIPFWRKLIIDYPQILDGSDVMTLGPDRFIRWNTEKTEHNMRTQDNYEIDLLQRRAIFGYHTELFSLCKYYDLQGKTFGSLGVAKYKATKTSRDTPCLYFGDEESPYVSVIYQDDACFRFVFEDGSEKSNIAYDDVESELGTL